MSALPCKKDRLVFSADLVTCRLVLTAEIGDLDDAEIAEISEWLHLTERILLRILQNQKREQQLMSKVDLGVEP